jgi:hypothetical protein
MLQAPLMHAGDDFGTQLMPGMVEGIAVHNTSLWYLRPNVCMVLDGARR